MANASSKQYGSMTSLKINGRQVAKLIDKNGKILFSSPSLFSNSNSKSIDHISVIYRGKDNSLKHIVVDIPAECDDVDDYIQTHMPQDFTNIIVIAKG